MSSSRRGDAGESFASARAFLDWLPQGRAACLVLDVHMDEMSGFDLHDKLAVPIIFITAHDDAATIERIEKSGASGHLRKPFGEKSILEANPVGRSVRPGMAEPPPTKTAEEPGVAR